MTIPVTVAPNKVLIEGEMLIYETEHGWFVDLLDLCIRIGYTHPEVEALRLSTRFPSVSLLFEGEARVAAGANEVIDFLEIGNGYQKYKRIKQKLALEIKQVITEMTEDLGTPLSEPPSPSVNLVDATSAFKEAMEILVECGATAQQIAHFKLDYYTRFASAEVKPVFVMAQSALQAMNLLQIAVPPKTNGRVACN